MDPMASKRVETVLSRASQGSIPDGDLPYMHSITAATHSLYLELEGICLMVDFVTGVSGRLLITRTGDSKDTACRVLMVEDIPITRELQVDWPQDSKELQILFSRPSEGVVYITFVWDTVSYCAT
jgi:hypothetical protein